MKLSSKGKTIIEVTVLLIAVTITYLFWNSFFIYPVKLFVVLLHELSHCIFALVSGGSVTEIKIDYQVGGECLVKGGNPYLIASAGYLGSLLLGGLLFISSNKYKFSKYFCTVLSLIFLIACITLIKSPFGILFTIGFSIILFFSPRILPNIVHSYLFKILGTISCLYTIIDIKDDLITSEYRRTDAQILADLTGVPAIIWGISIFIISVLVVYFLVRFNFRKQK
ncbi:MAG: M50 family metallopeptidase [Ignavibacteriales bacterium]|nr:M50 family metallopeptidase [Ignavibacteriales bacterium]